jgi:hypothetical protein
MIPCQSFDSLTHWITDANALKQIRNRLHFRHLVGQLIAILHALKDAADSYLYSLDVSRFALVPHAHCSLPRNKSHFTKEAINSTYYHDPFPNFRLSLWVNTNTKDWAKHSIKKCWKIALREHKSSNVLELFVLSQFTLVQPLRHLRGLFISIGSVSICTCLLRFTDYHDPSPTKFVSKQ